MTTAAAGNVAGHSGDKDKEKVEKRRALGRGLASLLPGPRVVPSPAAAAPQHPAASTASLPRAVDGGVGTREATPAPLSEIPPSRFATRHHDNAGGVATASTQDISADGASNSSANAHALASDINAVAHEGKVPIELNAAAESRIPSNLVANLAISDIDRNPFQTRYVGDDEALEELANSIKAQGVVQPIVVRPSEEDQGRYVLVIGERRLHASKKAGKTHIPALVRRISSQQAAEMTIIENLQREDLSPLEQAEAFRVLSNNFNMTQQEIGDRVGLSRASIANYMRLLKLPREVMELLAQKSINFAQAKELLKLEDNDRIAEAALYAVKKGMSIEQVQMLVLRMEGLLDPLPDMPGVKKKEKERSGARWIDPNVRSAQMDLERTLGLRVRIRDRKGKGKIVIEYSTVDDYERVVEMLRGRA